MFYLFDNEVVIIRNCANVCHLFHWFHLFRGTPISTATDHKDT
nr:hypothetical protein [Mucilaginibacter sp. X5P1]